MSSPVIHVSQLEDVTWNDTETCNYILGDATVIWRIHIPAHASKISELYLLLHLDEQEKAYRYYREADKQRFIIGRAYLRVLLGRYLKIPSHKISFGSKANGKPYIQSPPADLHYNVSHSGDYVLIAVCTNQVGIDVELLTPDVHYEDVMAISFNPEEIAYVHHSQNPVSAFYKLWTRKEALLKTAGIGIDEIIKNTPGLDGDHFIETTPISGPNDYFIQTFTVDETHVGSIANCKKNLLFLQFD